VLEFPSLLLELPLDPLFKRSFPSFEQLDVPLDLSSEHVLMQLENAFLLFELPFKKLQSGKLH